MLKRPVGYFCYNLAMEKEHLTNSPDFSGKELAKELKVEKRDSGELSQNLFKDFYHSFRLSQGDGYA